MKKELAALCLIFAVVAGCASLSGKANTDWTPPRQIKYDAFRAIGLKACREIDMGTLAGHVSGGQGEVFCQRRDFIKGLYQIQAVAEKDKDKDTVKSVNISVNGSQGAFIPASDSAAQKITEDFLQALKNAVKAD